MAFDPISLIIGKIIDAHKTRQQIGQGAGENPVQEGMGVNSGIKGLVSGLVGIPGGGGSEALNRVVSKSAPSVMESLGGMPMDHSLAMTALEPSIDPQKPLTGIAKTVDSLSQGVQRFNNLIGKVTNPVNQVVDTATSPITALTSPLTNLVGDVTQPVTGVANALAEPIGAISGAIEPLRTPGLGQKLQTQRDIAQSDQEAAMQLLEEKNTNAITQKLLGEQLQRERPATTLEGGLLKKDITPEQYAEYKNIGNNQYSSDARLVRDSLRESLGRDPTAKEIYDKVEKDKLDYAKIAGDVRAGSFAKTRGMNMIDTKTMKPVAMNWTQINKMNENEPGRYIPAAHSVTTMRQKALLEDIRGNIGLVRGALGRMPEFTADQATQISLLMKHRDPRSAFQAIFAGGIAQTLNPAQEDYLINLAQLYENAMAMRSVLGAGQGSEDLRAAILATLPSGATPRKKYARKQLDAFERVLDRLGRGLLNVPLAPEQNLGGAGTTKSGGKFKIIKKE